MAIKWLFINKTKQTTLADRAWLATSFLSRLKGLLFTSSIKTGQGLLLKPCNSIHMFWMLYAIDAIFIDKQGVVVGIVENLRPWSISKTYRGAHSCLELPPGTVSHTETELGDLIEWSKVH